MKVWPPRMRDAGVRELGELGPPHSMVAARKTLGPVARRGKGRNFSPLQHSPSSPMAPSRLQTRQASSGLGHAQRTWPQKFLLGFLCVFDSHIGRMVEEKHSRPSSVAISFRGQVGRMRSFLAYTHAPGAFSNHAAFGYAYRFVDGAAAGTLRYKAQARRVSPEQ
eukprot:1576323-Pleurochrysis_carterae.AAC.1